MEFTTWRETNRQDVWYSKRLINTSFSSMENTTFIRSAVVLQMLFGFVGYILVGYTPPLKPKYLMKCYVNCCSAR